MSGCGGKMITAGRSSLWQLNLSTAFLILSPWGVVSNTPFFYRWQVSWRPNWYSNKIMIQRHNLNLLNYSVGFGSDSPRLVIDPGSSWPRVVTPAETGIKKYMLDAGSCPAWQLIPRSLSKIPIYRGWGAVQFSCIVNLPFPEKLYNYCETGWHVMWPTAK